MRLLEYRMRLRQTEKERDHEKFNLKRNFMAKSKYEQYVADLERFH